MGYHLTSGGFSVLCLAKVPTELFLDTEHERFEYRI